MNGAAGKNLPAAPHIEFAYRLNFLFAYDIIKLWTNCFHS